MNEIILDLSNSSHANFFKEKNIIHFEAFNKVKEFLEQFKIKENILKNPSDRLTYKHNTITILGTRGSGKTSFLLSIEELLKDDKNDYNDLLFLDMIDPTLVEEKGHVFLYIISVICDKVSEKLNKKEVDCSDNIQCIKTNWKVSMNKLAKGLPSIDGIGGNKFGEWQDPEFVMQNELQSINSARKLAQYFSDFVALSLEILEKKQFVLFFDDIDVDSSKGYAVLETIRKYFVSDQIITFLSGDLKLYDALVREKKWSNFGSNLITYETSKLYQEEERRRLNSNHYNDMVTDLTSQYLIKIMQPKYRIHLATLFEYYKKNNTKIFVIENSTYVDGEKRNELQDFLKSIFEGYGVKSKFQRSTFEEFLLKQPLRTVVHFLHYFNNAEPKRHTDFISVFLSDLYEKHVNVSLLQESTTYSVATILKLLIQERRLSESYQLIPSTLDNSFNAAVFSSSLLLSDHFKNNKFLIFEYFIKIAYLRNFAEKESNEKRLLPIIETSGILNDTVFKDSTNRLLCGLYGYFHQLNSAEFGMLPLYGLSEVAKAKVSDSLFRIDYVLEQKNNNPVKRIVGYLPCFISQSSHKHSTEVFYSIISLLGCIGELSKRFDNNIIEENHIFNGIFELSQLRYYSVNNENRSVKNEPIQNNKEIENEIRSEIENDLENHSNEFDFTSNTLFNNYLLDWFSIKLHSISPYLLGKIFTRFYFSLKGIQTENLNLGEIFNLQIVSFFNAVLIEEAREFDSEINLNTNNIKSSSTIFINNLNKIKAENLLSRMSLTKWFLSSPILILYLDELIFDSIFNSEIDGEDYEDYKDFFLRFEVNSLLQNVRLFDVKIAAPKKSSTHNNDKSENLKKAERNRNALDAIKEELIKKSSYVFEIFPEKAKYMDSRVDKFFNEFNYILEKFKINEANERRKFAKDCVDFLKKKNLND